MGKMALPKKFWFLLSLSVLALLGSVSIIFLTSLNGIGMANDSRSYLVLARYFLNGSGQDSFLLKFFVVHFPPFFPFILAWCSRLSGLDPAEACRWLQAVLFGFNILLVGVLLMRYTKSVLISTGAAIAFIISAPIFFYHLSAVSESMFTFFMLLWLVFLIDFIEVSSKSSFVLCVLALMASCLTRWVGVTFVLTSMAGIFLFKKESIKTRCTHVAVLMSASLFPLLLWMVRNAVFIGKAIDRGRISFHPQGMAEYNIFNKFMFFNIHTPFFSEAEGVLLIIVMFFIGILIWSKRDKEELANVPDGVAIFIGVLFCFCLIYYAVLILTMTFIDALTTGERLLLPLNISWILLAGLLLHILLVSNRKSGFLKFVFIVLCLFAGVGSLVEAPQRAFQMYYHAVGSDNLQGDDLRIIAEAKKIPLDKILYTNSSNVLSFFDKRDSLELIPKYEGSTGSDSVYSIFMTRMKNDLKAHKAVLVYFDLIDFNQWAPSIEDIQKVIPLKAVVKCSNGAIYVEGRELGQGND